MGSLGRITITTWHCCSPLQWLLFPQYWALFWRNKSSLGVWDNRRGKASLLVALRCWKKSGAWLFSPLFRAGQKRLVWFWKPKEQLMAPLVYPENAHPRERNVTERNILFTKTEQIIKGKWEPFTTLNYRCPQQWGGSLRQMLHPQTQDRLAWSTALTVIRQVP